MRAELFVSLRPGLLWLVVFNLHSVLHFFRLDVAQLLRLHNVAEVTSIAVALQLLQQVQLVLLKLLDSCVQARHGREHLVVLLLEFGHFSVRLIQLCVQVVNLPQGFHILLLFSVQMVLDAAKSSLREQREPLLALQIVLKITDLVHEVVVLFLVLVHLLLRLILLLLGVDTELMLYPEHLRQQFGVAHDVLQFVGEISLLLRSRFELRIED